MLIRTGDIYVSYLCNIRKKAAGEWAVKQMAEWGLENGHLEEWNFGHPGWANERLTGHIVSPVKESLVCEVLAWTPGTKGNLTGPGLPVKSSVITQTRGTQPVLRANERVIEDDAKKSAVEIAAAVYFLSMNDQLLPRFSNAEMPPLPPQRRRD